MADEAVQVSRSGGESVANGSTFEEQRVDFSCNILQMKWEELVLEEYETRQIYPRVRISWNTTEYPQEKGKWCVAFSMSKV